MSSTQSPILLPQSELDRMSRQAMASATMQTNSNPTMSGGLGFRQVTRNNVFQDLFRNMQDEAIAREQGRRDRINQFQFDPNTGLSVGEMAMPDADIAPEVQARQDRIMRRLQQQKLSDATDMQRGALGLLQSFRPGGGAALEAGIYNQVAGGLRAESTAFEPLDLMYRAREAQAEADRRAARKASKRSTFGAIVGAVATIGGALVGGPVGATVGAGVSGSLNSGLAGEGLGTGPTGYGGAGHQGGTISTGGMAATLDPQTGAPAPQPTVADTAGPGRGGAGPVPGPGARGGAPAGPAAPQPSPAAPAPLGVGADAPGAAGDFGHAAFSAASARSYQDPLQARVMQMALNESIADMYDSDPFFGSFGQAVNELLNTPVGVD